MFKTFFTSLALTVGFVHPSIASDISKLPTDLMCVGQKTLAETITEFEELPFVGGVSMRELPEIGMVENNLVIFVNPKTQSYTIVERFSKEVYCVVSIGQGFRPLSGK